MGKGNKCTVSQLMVRNWAATGAQLPQLSANQNSHLNDFLNCYCKNEQDRKLNYHVNYTSDEVASPSTFSFTSLYPFIIRVTVVLLKTEASAQPYYH